MEVVGLTEAIVHLPNAGLRGKFDDASGCAQGCCGICDAGGANGATIVVCPPSFGRPLQGSLLQLYSNVVSAVPGCIGELVGLCHNSWPLQSGPLGPTGHQLAGRGRHQGSRVLICPAIPRSYRVWGLPDAQSRHRQGPEGREYITGPTGVTTSTA